MRLLMLLPALAGFAAGACPIAHDARDIQGDTSFLSSYEVDDKQTYLSTEAGGRIDDQGSLKAGPRGPTLLEDFRFRQKIQHFDHERVPERAVHARGAGAHGTFTSYRNWGNITGASFLSSAGKKTSTFVRFSTVAGSRGSADTVRDVHGFATRFFTDEGNFDIVGNNIPVFFIQDAIQFPDLIHAVKPRPDREIPGAATAHDSAYDYFSLQPSTLHTLFWAMSGFGIPRSYRHMDGFGVHTFRFVADDGKSTLIKWHWKSKQGKASLVWEEAQVLAGKNADYHRQDLWDAIATGNGPEWELCVQIVEEADARTFDFDLMDPTKFIPEEIVPLVKLGVMKLEENPVNFFAETEQIMFQPGHIVRGIDFSEDSLLQGRLFSYLDTQLNRNGGPNFEQLPINRPRVAVHSNNRDGAGQMSIHTNPYAYSPNTLNGGSPFQADYANGRGFFTAPSRRVDGSLTNALSPTLDDHWTQPRLFYNSLIPAEQQLLINALRFEMSHIESSDVQLAMLKQLNRVSNDISSRVADALGLKAPAPDPTYYHDEWSDYISICRRKLPTIATLKVAVLATSSFRDCVLQGLSLKRLFAKDDVVVTVVGERLVEGVDKTYSAVDAAEFDGIVVADGAEFLFQVNASLSTLYPVGRPTQILTDGYRWGKPIGAIGSATAALDDADIGPTRGVFTGDHLERFARMYKDGLAVYKYVDRFPLDRH